MVGRFRRDFELAPHVDGFRDHLLSLGNTPGTVANEMAVIGRLRRWLHAADLRVAFLSAANLDRFIADRRRDGHGHSVVRHGLMLFRRYLIDVGVLPADQKRPPDAVDELVASYCEWLLHDRGLSPTTVRRYQATARWYLAQRPDGVDVSRLTSTEVTSFLLAITTAASVGSAKGHVAEIRSLLNFLFVTGRTLVVLADSVPPIAGWHDTGIPPGCRATQFERSWTAAIRPRRSESATGRSCCWSLGWVCGPSRWHGCVWKTCIGGSGKSRSAARHVGWIGSRCRSTPGRRSPIT